MECWLHYLDNIVDKFYRFSFPRPETPLQKSLRITYTGDKSTEHSEKILYRKL